MAEDLRKASHPKVAAMSKIGVATTASCGSAATAHDKIQEMVRRIVDGFHPDRIILFGSYARGTAGPDSDVDLLVIKPVSGSKRKERLEIRTALRGIGLPKDIILATPEEAEESWDLVGTVIYPALREGKVLYERPI